MSEVIKRPQTEIDSWLNSQAQKDFRFGNIVVEMKYFNDWGYPNQLVKIVDSHGTTTYSDVIEIKRDGVSISRLQVGCLDSKTLGTYELSWEKIDFLIKNEKGTYRDNWIVISKKDLYKLLELREKYVEGNREEESLRRL